MWSKTRNDWINETFDCFHSVEWMKCRFVEVIVFLFHDRWTTSFRMNDNVHLWWQFILFFMITIWNKERLWDSIRDVLFSHWEKNSFDRNNRMIKNQLNIFSRCLATDVDCDSYFFLLVLHSSLRSWVI